MWRGWRLKAGRTNETTAYGKAAAATLIAACVGRRYSAPMTFVSIKDAQLQLADLARRVKLGETIVVTQDGQPLMDIVPHQVAKEQKKGGIDLEAGWAYLRSQGITDPFPYIADDFDDPLPEDFLIAPLPPDFK
jgi:antitoxin (DNA-binding transcriptional repressor) of toxin-antitoxin stability system